MTRYLNILSGLIAPNKVRQYVVRSGVKQTMAPPHFLIIDDDPEKPDIGTFLYSFRSNGDCVGDTWHKNVEDAKHQADFQYENLVQEWQDIPPDVDMIAYGLARLSPAPVITPELETLDQLDGGDLRLTIIREVYPDADHFLRGVHGLLQNGDVRLLEAGSEVPKWRWRDLFENGSIMTNLEGFVLSITDQGVKRIA